MIDYTGTLNRYKMPNIDFDFCWNKPENFTENIRNSYKTIVERWFVQSFLNLNMSRTKWSEWKNGMRGRLGNYPLLVEDAWFLESWERTNRFCASIQVKFEDPKP